MKLIILDRDGVINQDSKAFVKSPDEWLPLPGSLEAMARLSQSGWRIAIATNQSGLARGLFDMETLNAMHAKMRRALAALGGSVDAIFVCPHGPEDGCRCRKPAPGLLQDIGRRFDIPLAGVPVVGDSLRDLQAAAAVGAQPWLARTGNGAATAGGSNLLPPGTRIGDNLAAIVDTLLAEQDTP
ncbi:D-glycero-beta-D-manno-heptose 1,7-bisphosphate 7-phosphatase [Kerstersia gyiorum]|uniref:D,D-heptose 1,7-bisphosphate phosphatase n=1 Tax=Kerstersia gyiorum TaxID=206506 RepID=A0A171KUF8_9BURK|nr:D-glycero-beta-D-manno-heptose 1,7-bisphosphate 7-phosphatase [Kerstersia gyiorum]AZV93316.1 D-glycero-beta-D-manno-heptose-1,7-bisphosphate 7-phosphatase [Bordetella sp. J329]KKO72525.1 D,D-heptose 1,7-bisphosphate phosphatase [Kerstersia gyiorum]MCH4272918.1 D-glycero-beta-D-manno-heptose 1,7-bisphosphate 7-phosphatase [Kerstersia gyiorum]MCI1229337.1 D-glycero-beta-D-manno-heptose 1,7-bisphosphate 7-phosphatase [Kerstersia gyiorum]